MVGARIEIGVAHDECDIVITVEDDGPGLAVADCERIFERGVSTNNGLNVPRLASSSVCAMAPGSPATMPAKISIEMPLPMPRSVTGCCGTSSCPAA